MIRPNTKLHFAKTAEAAGLAAKKKYDFHCIVYGVNRHAEAGGLRLDAAHVFPRSTFPELAKCQENILPITSFRHSWRGALPDGSNSDCLDLVIDKDFPGGRDRRPIERFHWIRKNTHEVYREWVHDQLASLVLEAPKLSAQVSAMYFDLIEILAGWND